MAGGGDAEFASQPLSVTGEDLTNLIVTTSKGATATGKVTFEGQRPPGDLRVTSVSADEGPSPLGRRRRRHRRRRDVHLERAVGAVARWSASAACRAGYTLKAVEHNGLDVTDTGVEIKGTDAISGIDLVRHQPERPRSAAR